MKNNSLKIIFFLGSVFFFGKRTETSFKERKQIAYNNLPPALQMLSLEKIKQFVFLDESTVPVIGPLQEKICVQRKDKQIQKFFRETRKTSLTIQQVYELLNSNHIALSGVLTLAQIRMLVDNGYKFSLEQIEWMSKKQISELLSHHPDPELNEILRLKLSERFRPTGWDDLAQQNKMKQVIFLYKFSE
ncbi:hypothetical protein HYV11_00960 [Candidatus Dependentiae bacterium]|nr:hypothetical protein [Candidatus Dependentiae bacterium]